jgi:hypothetical protein
MHQIILLIIFAEAIGVSQQAVGYWLERRRWQQLVRRGDLFVRLVTLGVNAKNINLHIHKKAKCVGRVGASQLGKDKKMAVGRVFLEISQTA